MGEGFGERVGEGESFEEGLWSFVGFRVEMG